MKKTTKTGRPANNPGLRRSWLGESLRARRRVADLSLDELGEHIGVSASTISRWETNYNEPSPSAIAALCDALGCLPTAFTKKPKLK